MTPVDLAFARAYHAVGSLVAASPALMGFAGWPAATPAQKSARPIPAADLLKTWSDGHIAATQEVRDAVRDLSDFANWQQTYTAEEVGQDFLDRYGWFELVGPEGHFQSQDICAYIAYWGENLYYPWHLHEAEELYYILAGEAFFEAEGAQPVTLRPGDTRIHSANQPHQMTTGASPVRARGLWRGEGLSGVPRMGTK